MRTNRIALIICLLMIASACVEARTVLKMTYTVDKNDAVELLELKPTIGTFDRENPRKQSYSLYIEDGDQLLYTSYLPLSFKRSFVGETDEMTEWQSMDKITVMNKLPYFGNYGTIKIYHDDKVIFSYDLKNLCNDDKVCNNYENSLVCKDCDVTKDDSVCIAKADGICDPDCKDNIDADCIKKEAAVVTENQEVLQTAVKRSYVYLYLTIAAIVIFIITLYFHYRYKKK
jgi:hypothetical protein